MSAFAQQTGGGTLTGTVSDKDGVVPGASVTVTAVATGSARTSPTNEAGLFRVAGLAPDTYTIKVEVTGFKTMTVSDILLTSGEIRDIGKVVLQVGGTAETVNVTAEVTPVQVATSARKAAITSDELSNIMMKGRDIYGFIALVPGVMDTNFSATSRTGIQRNRRRSTAPREQQEPAGRRDRRHGRGRDRECLRESER